MAKRRKKEKVYEVSYPLYTDYANVVENQLSSKNSSRETFPMILYDMMEVLGESGRNDIAHWQSHGRSFIIRDKERFIKEVLPVFFPKQTKYSSFHRQLNNYGFLRITRPGADENSFYHELFLRGRKDLSSLISRSRKYNNTERESLNPNTATDFHRMEPVVARPSVATSEATRASNIHPNESNGTGITSIANGSLKTTGLDDSKAIDEERDRSTEAGDKEIKIAGIDSHSNAGYCLQVDSNLDLAPLPINTIPLRICMEDDISVGTLSDVSGTARFLQNVDFENDF